MKLRFDFFEAKRRDLLAAARRARDALRADERREKESSSQQLALVAKESGLTQGAVLALNSDTLKLERQKLLRAQEGRKRSRRRKTSKKEALRGIYRRLIGGFFLGLEAYRVLAVEG